MAFSALGICALPSPFRYFIFTKFIGITSIKGNLAEHLRPEEHANMSCRDDDDDDNDGWIMTYSILTSQCNYRETRKGFKSRRFDILWRKLGECSFSPSPVPVPHTNNIQQCIQLTKSHLHIYIYTYIYIHTYKYKYIYIYHIYAVLWFVFDHVSFDTAHRAFFS